MRTSPLILMLLTLTLGLAAADPPAPAGDAARQQLRQVLDRPDYQRWRLREFRDGRPAPDESWLDRWLRSWADQFERWLRRREPAGPSRPPEIGSLAAFFRIMAWAVVAGLVAVLLVVLYRLWRQRQQAAANPAAVLSRHRIREAMEQGDALALGSDDWLDEAARFHDDSDFRAVYRALYLALLSGLHAGRKIDFRANRTNWVYVHHYRGGDDERQTFRSLTALFDAVWYGQQPTAGQDLPRLRAQVESLVRPAEAAR